MTWGGLWLLTAKGKAKMSVKDERSFKEVAKGIRIRDGDVSSDVAGVGKIMWKGDPSGRESSCPSVQIKSVDIWRVAHGF